MVQDRCIVSIKGKWKSYAVYRMATLLMTLSNTIHLSLPIFLGRLLRVDLIQWVSNVRPSVRPQNVSSISMKFGMQLEVDK